MTEKQVKYHVGSINNAKPLLAIEDRIAQVHAHHQGIPCETGEQWLQRLPERLRDLADPVSGKARTGDVAYTVAAIIGSIENAPTDAGLRRR